MARGVKYPSLVVDGRKWLLRDAECRQDLAERTAKFGDAVIDMAKLVKVTEITRDMITQFVNAATSVHANYCEADEAETKKDFRYRISICKKEARESRGWVRFLVRAQPDLQEVAAPLAREARELTLIFAAIHRNSAPAT